MLNATGGVGGRTIKFITYDDAYSPPKTVEQVRRMVESDQVEVMMGILGTSTNAAVQKYLNDRKIPQLFSLAASAKFGIPSKDPWTMGFPPTATLEGKIYGKYILDTKPNAKIAVLYQNDDLGRGSRSSQVRSWLSGGGDDCVGPEV